MKTDLVIRQKIRPLSQRKLDRMTEGAIRTIRDRGYDVPLRRAKLRNGRELLPMPSFVRREMRVVVGSDIVFCLKAENGILDIAEEGALDERDVDGLPIMGDVVAGIKVRREGWSTVITIPKKAQAVLGDVNERFLQYGRTNYPGKVTLKIFETTAVSEETVETLSKHLQRWPVLVENCTPAWLEGFEPFAKAMAEIELPPRYPRRDRRNLYRAAVVFMIMIGKGARIIELQRSEEWSSRS
jgi:hypothetical protein